MHPNRGRSNELGKYAGLGLQFAATFMLFGAFGYWLDHEWGTRPWFLIAGIFLGATGAFIWLVRQMPTVGPASKGTARAGESPAQTAIQTAPEIKTATENESEADTSAADSGPSGEDPA